MNKTEERTILTESAKPVVRLARFGLIVVIASCIAVAIAIGFVVYVITDGR